MNILHIPAWKKTQKIFSFSFFNSNFYYIMFLPYPITRMLKWRERKESEICWLFILSLWLRLNVKGKESKNLITEMKNLYLFIKGDIHSSPSVFLSLIHSHLKLWIIVCVKSFRRSFQIQTNYPFPIYSFLICFRELF